MALHAERAGGDVHQTVKAVVEVFLVGREIGDARHVDRDDADGAGAFARPEEAATLFAELAEVKAETAAHGTDVARFHVRIDVIGEIGGAVFRRHREEELVVFGRSPVKVLRDGIGRDRVLESAAVGVALDHDFDEGFVDHGHLLGTIAIGEVHFLAADEGRHVLEVVRDRPVQGDVRKRRLGAPTRRGVHAINEGLDALFDLFIGQVVDFDERSEIGVEGRESLRPCPFVLHDAEEVDHLVAKGHEVTGRARGDLACDASKALSDQLLERPAGTVTGEHGKVVDVNVRVAVGVGDFFVIDFAEPVVRGNSAGVRKDKAADGIGDGRIFLHTPVGNAEVIVDDVLEVEARRFDLAERRVLVAVFHVGFRNVDIVRLDEGDFDGVLNVLDGHLFILNLVVENRGHAKREDLDDVRGGIFVLGAESAFNGAFDFAEVERDNGPVSFGDL